MNFSQTAINTFIQKLPAFQDMLAAQEKEVLAAHASERKRLIEGVQAAIQDGAKAEKTMAAQKAKVQAAQKTLDAENAVLAEMNARLHEATNRESGLLSRLVSNPDLGEADLEHALNFVQSAHLGLTAGIASAQTEITGMRSTTHDWMMGSTPPSKDLPKAEENLRALQEERQHLSRAHDALARLRLSTTLDPEGIRNRVTAIMAGAGIHRNESGGWFPE